MGQKVNPIGLRLGINRTWDSRWYAGKNEYGGLLHEDIKIREELMEALKQAAVSKIERRHDLLLSTLREYLTATGAQRPRIVVEKDGVEVSLDLDTFTSRA